MKKGVIFGIFDLLHIGHVKVLKEAKKHCDHLIVYVIDDSVAQSYKRMPIIVEKDRLEMVRTIRFIDEAHLVDHREPVDFQDVHYYFVSERLKGSKLHYVPEHRLKDVIYLPYSEGVSTSLIIKLCREQ